MVTTRSLLLPTLSLPGVFTQHPLPEGGDALASAVRLAGSGGAGTLAWAGGEAQAAAAVVLEPERTLGAARLALLAAGNALVDALGVLGPPEVPLAWRWPGTLLVDGGACGRLRLVAPPDAADPEIPDWLVVGFEVVLALPAGLEPGRDPGRTGLAEEGFAGITAAALTEAWARHLMAGLDRWEAAGPGRMMADFLARLLDGQDQPGLRRAIDPATGDLLLDRSGVISRLPPA